MSFLSSSLLLISINLLLSVWMEGEASSQCSALQCGSCLSLTFSALGSSQRYLTLCCHLVVKCSHFHLTSANFPFSPSLHINRLNYLVFVYPPIFFHFTKDRPNHNRVLDVSINAVYLSVCHILRRFSAATHPSSTMIQL